MVKKFEDMCNRFDRIPACERQTDWWTDRQTDGHLATAYSVLCIASRGKNPTIHVWLLLCGLGSALRVTPRSSLSVSRARLTRKRKKQRTFRRGYPCQCNWQNNFERGPHIVSAWASPTCYLRKTSKFRLKRSRYRQTLRFKILQ